MHDSASITGPLGLAWALPFIGLLLTIALAPLAAPRLWHHHYGKLAALWALALLVPDAIRRGAGATLVSLLDVALHEYLPFLLLLGALFVVAGGLRVTGTPRASPAVNTVYLAVGAALASWIGTTGAAMVLIRPLIRTNRDRPHAGHVFVFFILLVANVGGALTPLGDPPLFLGYLLGVPFFWPTVHLFLPTVTVAGGLLAVFFVVDRVMAGREPTPAPRLLQPDKLALEGAINLALLAAVIATVFLRGAWHPQAAFAIMGVEWGIGEIVGAALLVGIASLSLLVTPRAIRAANDFTWAPMIEVAILFAAIFVTLQPVMAMIAEGKAGPAAPLLARLIGSGAACATGSGGCGPNVPLFYWTAGALSAFLDNAPTYVVFFGFGGGDAAALTGKLAPVLTAISAGAVYFGALSYIGNAPNFMVKAIVESQGITMPSFFAYLGWACVLLLPWLALVDVVFLR